MSDYLRLTKDGLKEFKNNGERRSQYRYTKFEDRPALKHKTDGTIFTFDTEEKREAFFYDESPAKHFWPNLRSQVYIDPGFTLGDLMLILESYTESIVLTQFLFPFYPMIAGGESQGDPAEVLVLHARGEITDNHFVFSTDFGFFNTRNWTQDTLLEIDESFGIYKYGKEIVRCRYGFSLLELLKALYEFTPAEPVALMKHGLFDDKGKPVENPLQFLFSPVAIEEEFTVADLVKFVESDETLRDFLACYSWCNRIEELNKQVQLPSESREELWHTEVYQRFKAAPLENYWFNFEPSFHAVGELSETEQEFYKANPEKTQPNHTDYSLGWTTLNRIATLPFVARKETPLFILDEKQSIVREETVQVDFTLLDVLDAFYWEMSFYGGPDQELKQEIIKRFEEEIQ